MDELRADDPRWIGGYRLLGRLGAGGMGRVYLGRSPRGRTVAVKLVRAELAEQDEFRSRFRREVRAARRVGGTWTAPVLDADTEADVPWVATGYVAGPSLQQVVGKDHGPLPESSVLVLASGLAYALADIHAAGLVHRDLKPSNVMITIDGPRVIDFGIARALETVADDGLVTYTGAMVGSPAFMSPEQVRGDRVTPACDVFCLGSVLAYAASGLQPFGAGTSGVHAQMFRIVQEPPELDAVPPALRELVAACLTKDPLERPALAQVQERIAAARAAAAGDGSTASDAADRTGADTAGDTARGTAGAIPGQRTRGGTADEPWLPGAIVAQLGRQAVRLLELEAAETGSLPVVTRAGAAAAAAGAPGSTPPPPGPSGSLPAAPAGTPAPPGGTPAASPPAAGPAGAPAPAPVPQPRPEPAPAQAQAQAQVPAKTKAKTEAQPQVQATAPAPDRSTAVAAPGRPEPVGPPSRAARRARMFTLVGVLAVIAAGATAYVAVREQRGDSNGGSADPKPTASAASAARTPAAQAPVAAGPAAPSGMVGTWKATFDGGAAPGTNTRILTVHRDGRVELAGDGPAYSCAWSMRVTATSPAVALSPSAVARAQPATSCRPGGRTTLVLLDGTHLRRDDADPATAPLTYEKVG